MNVKRILVVTLVALLACLALTGAGSAFTVTQGAVSDPSGSLVPGEEVTANMKVMYYNGDMNVGGSLTLKTDLVGQSWTVDVYKGSIKVTELHPSYASGYTISGFDLSGYATDIELAIKVEGTVSSDSAGKSISAIMLSETGTSGSSGLKTYSSTPQKVYDTGNLASSLQKLNDAIVTMDAAISEYIAAGYDCSAPKALLETARSKYQAAVAAGTENGVTAFSNYEQGMEVIERTQQAIANVALSMVLTYINEIDGIVTQLYANGWNSEATLVDTKNTKLKISYDTYLKQYQAGSVSLNELKDLRIETVDLYNEANQYLEDSQNPLGGIVGFLPYILIGVGVIVVGIIVFFLLRRRRNSWDELG